MKSSTDIYQKIQLLFYFTSFYFILFYSRGEAKRTFCKLFQVQWGVPWYVAVIPALRMLRQEDHELKESLGYAETPWQTSRPNTRRKNKPKIKSFRSARWFSR